MTSLDRVVLAEKVASVERHLARVADRLPDGPLDPASDASDAVILHLWQAVQIALDVAVALCAHRRLGTPTGYADAFRRLGQAGILPADLVTRLARAAGFRNAVAHTYEGLDLIRVREAAERGPDDLRAFLAAARDSLAGG